MGLVTGANGQFESNPNHLAGPDHGASRLLKVAQLNAHVEIISCLETTRQFEGQGYRTLSAPIAAQGKS